MRDRVDWCSELATMVTNHYSLKYSPLSTEPLICRLPENYRIFHASQMFVAELWNSLVAKFSGSIHLYAAVPRLSTLVVSDHIGSATW